MLLFTPIVPNATVMLRLAFVRRHGISYDSKLPIAEDYDFVLQCSRHCTIGMVDRVLYRYRVTENSLMDRYSEAEEKSFAAVKIVHARVLDVFGLEATDDKLRLHRVLNSGLLFTDFGRYEAAFDWLLGLLEHNERTGYYDRRVFRQAVADRFYFITKKASRFGVRTLLFYLRESARHGIRIGEPVKLAKLSVRCLIRYDKF
jgi:hypothetical protein